MKKYEDRKPRYVREWYLELKKKWRKKVEANAHELALAARVSAVAADGGSPKKVDRASVVVGTGDALKALAKDAGLEFKLATTSLDFELDDESRDSQRPMNEQDIYEELLIDKIEFSDDEDVQDDGRNAFKKASRHKMVEEPGTAGGKADINLAGYFNFFL